MLAPPWQQWRDGRHSRIPTCCLAFYVLWRGRWPLSWYQRWPAYGRDPDPAVGYVRCPSCLKLGRVAPIHWCDDSCPPGRYGC